MQLNGVHISNIYETWRFIYGTHTCSSYETYMKNGPDIYADIYVLCKFPIFFDIYVHICVIYGHICQYVCHIWHHVCATYLRYKYAQYMVRIRHLYAKQFRLSYMLHIRDISGVSVTQHPGDHTLYDLKKIFVYHAYKIYWIGLCRFQNIKTKSKNNWWFNVNYTEKRLLFIDALIVDTKYDWCCIICYINLKFT